MEVGGFDCADPAGKRGLVVEKGMEGERGGLLVTTL